MLFDQQRVKAETIAIRIDTETALRHANAVREQNSRQRRTSSRQWLNPARQFMAAIAGTRRRTRRNIPTSGSRSRSGESAAPVTLPMHVGIPRGEP